MNNQNNKVYIELKNNVINNFIKEHTRNGFPPDFYKCIHGFTDYIYETCVLSGGFRYQDLNEFTYISRLTENGFTKELIRKLSDVIYEYIYRKLNPPNNHHKSRYYMNVSL